MTKKDYIIIATSLNVVINHSQGIDDHTAERIITSLAYALKNDNPKFNPTKFLKVVFGKDLDK